MIDSYEQHGIVFPIRVLSESEVIAFRSQLVAIAQENQRRLENLHLAYPWAYRLASHRKVLDAVESLIGRTF
jgi:hypothetical protein